MPLNDDDLKKMLNPNHVQLQMPKPDEDEPEPPGRYFGDVDATRNNIFNHSLSAISSIQPVESATHRLSLRGAQYVDPDRYSLKDEKNAITTGGTLARRIRGTWVLEDKATGQVLDQRQATVARIPYMTQRGTFIRGGINYSPAHQPRLLPGIYTRRKGSGEIEGHVNVKAGTGVVHRLMLEPEKGVFRMQFAQSNLPLFPVLRALGVSEQEMKDAWGKDLASINTTYNDPQATKKLYARLLGKRGTAKNDLEMDEQLRETFGKMELDPYTSKKLLGEEHRNLSGKALLQATKNMLAVSRGERDVDNRDSWAFRELLGPEDLIAERFRKSKKGLLPLLWKAAQRKKLDRMPIAALDSLMDEVLQDGALVQGLEEINAIDAFDQQTRATQLGVGGISCYSADTDVLVRGGWKNWPDVTEEDEFACLDGDELVFRRPNKLFSGDYVGEMLGGHTVQADYLVTPNHRMYVRSSTSGSQAWTDWTFRSAEEVHGKSVKHKISCGGYMGGESPETYAVHPAPVQGENAAGAIKVPAIFPMLAWAKFLGYYLADGSFSYVPSRKEYRIEIGKSIEANLDEHTVIAKTLCELGVNFRYEQGRRFILKRKHLAHYVSKFGKSWDKYVPDYIMNGSLEVRRAFFEALTMCDHSVQTDTLLRYESASRKLRDQAGWLAISLGKAVCYYQYRGNLGQPRYLLVARTATQAGISLQKNKTQYDRVSYAGKVYCAEVPGGLVFVRRNGKAMWCGNSPDAVPDESRGIQSSQAGFIDPIRTPERSNVGTDTRLAIGARKGDDGRIYQQVKDAKSGRKLWRSPQQMADMVVAFPGELQNGKPYSAVLNKGELDYVPNEEVEAEMGHAERQYNPLTALIPGKYGAKPARILMGARMFSQALPLVDPEAPHVQAADPDSEDGSFEEKYGEKLGAVKAKQGGRVMSVDPEGIVVKHSDGTDHTYDLYDRFPLNRKSEISNTAMVKPGDEFQPGQLLAKSNFTDDKGRVAFGKNVRVAYMASGDNFEDGWTISESLAKRMASASTYQNDHEYEKDMLRSKNDYLGLFPKKHEPEALKKLDDDGVIKVGQKVNYGEPLVLSAAPTQYTKDQASRSKKSSFVDKSLTWDHHSPGEVTQVIPNKNGVNVIVKAIDPSEVGDKLVTRYGTKGILSDIRPDHEMPHDKDGQPFELLADPEGIVSRANPVLLAEALLGKIAAKTGKPYKLKDFDSTQALHQYVKDELRKNDMKDLEDLIDPQTGTKIPGILTGNIFMTKLHHSALTKQQGRGLGAYTSTGEPAKVGGPEGSAKRWSMMDIYAVLAHGGAEVARDAGLIRGQVNPEYWQQYMLGHRPPEPDTPLVYKKFLAHLQGSGINVKRTADQQMHLFAMRDTDVDKLAGHRILKNSDTVKWNEELEPIKGGLFDKSITGGHGGKEWSYFPISEKLPSPVMEEPIKKLLGLNGPEFEKILYGQESLLGKTGPEAIEHALKQINVPKALAQARLEMRSTKKGLRDRAVQRLQYLKAAQANEQHPSEWMISKVPVLPPIFRPVSKMQGGGGTLVADANHLYKDLMDADKNMLDIRDHVDDVSEERKATYGALKAVYGLGDPVNVKNKERGVKGLLAQVFASSPKYGHMQYRLLGGTLDNVGRSTISPDHNIPLDSVGIPENTAWTVYQPYIIRRLVRRGVNPRTAVDMVQNRDKLAKSMLTEELAARPVLLNRAPVLHKYGYLAFKPMLTSGNTIKINPLVNKGYGADFDGDNMNYTVPASDKAARQAMERMLPSKNLISPSDFKSPVFQPTQQYLVGLWEASSKIDKKSPVKIFRNQKDVMAAFERGEITAKTRVRILEKPE